MRNLENAVHLCIDMQNIFAPGGVWQTPWMEKVLPNVEAIAGHCPARTVFSRFITPERAEDRPGAWQEYFRRWDAATRPQLQPGALELVPALARFAPPARVLDKPFYSAFTQTSLHDLLAQKGVATVIVTGAETDVCVSASVFSAVDLGYHVLIVEDALCSSSDEGHDALMTMFRTRLSQQISLIETDELLDVWKPAN